MNSEEIMGYEIHLHEIFSSYYYSSLYHADNKTLKNVFHSTRYFEEINNPQHKKFSNAVPSLTFFQLF